MVKIYGHPKDSAAINENYKIIASMHSFSNSHRYWLLNYHRQKYVVVVTT